MFNIFEKKGQTIIQLTAGDSASITTTPYSDANNDNSFNPTDNDEPIILDENSYVMFIVASPSGRTYIKKFLTVDDYNDNNELVMNLNPSDTKDMQPFRYLFSFTYFPNENEQYTYSTGIFEILKSLGNVDTLDEYLNPPVDDTVPDDDNTDGSDTEPIEPDIPDDSGDDTPTEPDDNKDNNVGDDNIDDTTGGDIDGG